MTPIMDVWDWESVARACGCEHGPMIYFVGNRMGFVAFCDHEGLNPRSWGEVLHVNSISQTMGLLPAQDDRIIFGNGGDTRIYEALIRRQKRSSQATVKEVNITIMDPNKTQSEQMEDVRPNDRGFLAEDVDDQTQAEELEESPDDASDEG